MLEDTIAAITTPLGASSVGIIRISGPDAAQVADRVFQAKRKIKLQDSPSYTITYGTIRNEQGQVIDEALALTMWRPRSFTGENVVELQCHGGRVVLKKTLELVLASGARLAEPGEFSKRAFLNGRLDLAQAEAIMDLITAKTERGLQAAAGNLQGQISQKVRELREILLEVIAYLEADIDFPEEEFARMTDTDLDAKLQKIRDGINKILQNYKSGRIIRDGLKTALIGRPNVGKSSLLNALLKEKRAIVTDIPGTTRDTIEEYYNLAGIPLVLIDTAGIRDTQDLVERLGVEKTREIMEKADLILYIIDIVDGVTEDDLKFMSEIPKEKMIVLVNKIDLWNRQAIKPEALEGQVSQLLKDYKVVFISAAIGQGLTQLEKSIEEMVFDQGLEAGEDFYVTNTRQKDALQKAVISLDSARKSLQKNIPHDFISIDLHQAWLTLGEVTGETVSDDLLNEIFSRFCLGK